MHTHVYVYIYMPTKVVALLLFGNLVFLLGMTTFFGAK